jgi:hypothetical protein
MTLHSVINMLAGSIIWIDTGKNWGLGHTVPWIVNH